MNFRRMTSDDLGQVEHIQADITRRPVPEPWREMLAKHVGNSECVGFVAEEDGQVLGFIVGEIRTGGFGAVHGGWIEMVGVSPGHMGAGIGRNLGRELCEYFNEMGVTDVFTAVLWDSGDLLAFFKGLGFDRSPYINLQLKLGK